jgi:hypothetical protein
LQGLDLHVFDSLGVKSKDAEIVDGITVDGVSVNLLVVVEDDVTPERAGADNMSIGKNISATSVNQQFPS